MFLHQAKLQILRAAISALTILTKLEGRWEFRSLARLVARVVELRSKAGQLQPRRFLYLSPMVRAASVSEGALAKISRVSQILVLFIIFGGVFLHVNYEALPER